jgi:hypothetical protein
MGLDIMHYKICVELENEFVPDLKITTKSDIQRFDVNIKYFKDYWKPIFKYSCRNNIKVAFDNENYEKAKQSWNEWNPEIEVLKSTIDKKQELIN